MNCTPSLLNDFIYCKNRIFWIFNEITNIENSNILLGNILEDNSTKIKFNGFEIDKIDIKNKCIIEYKKNYDFEGNEYQILYYLYLLKFIYPNYKGKLLFHENSKEKIVTLNKNSEEKLIKKIKEYDFFIKNIKYDEKIKGKICKGCRFEELCNI